MKLLLVSVGRRRYAVAADAVARIMDPTLEPDFRREAGSEEATHRGVRYPVIDLHGAVDRGPGGPPLYLVVETGSGRAMVPVDGAEAIREIPGTAIAPLPSFIFAGERRLFRGVFSDGHWPRLLLDADALR